jgi:hypothetical protein
LPIRLSRSFARIAPLLLLATLALPAVASAAGVICGTVRDAVSQAPVARAGLFLRTTAGAYTGLNAASDDVGHYCIGGIPAGTYDLEVRVDDHVATTLRNISVSDDVTGVGDVELGAGILLSTPSPNPASLQLRLAFRLPAPESVAIDVLDLQGRLVRSWRSTSASAGDHSFIWDLRGPAGDPLGTGLYLVRLRAGGVTRIRSFLRLR